MQYLIKIWKIPYVKPTSAFADANIALKKPTKLSSVFEQYNSTYALDGDRSDRSIHGDFICAQSDSVANQQSWWAVDLQNVYVINDVDIFGRTDCCYDAFANFDVEIILPTCTCNHWNNLEEGDKINCHYQETESQKITVTCPSNTIGRYVRIKRRDTVYLIICEVEVYGNPLNSLRESGWRQV
ncbi:fucolectin-like [Mytilus californianus]|uniref:fucolectin-like n=1 Tax=Mytilus californianus TaxID=6549 RepID=UPI0022457511|nr:fucolectin-like [Mytilus californianus]